MNRHVFVALLMSALLLPACAKNPSTGRSQLILLSSSEVAAMGIEAKPQLIQEFGGEVAEAPLREYVSEVGRRIAGQVEPEFEGIEWEFITLESDVINAFALPGGKVFITKGLLSKFTNEAQVAGVLGHEIGHVTARHIDERLSQTLLAQLGLSVLSEATDSGLIQLGASAATQTAMMGFGRGQETESDAQGLKYMTRAGYDPSGMIEVLEVLLEASKGGTRAPEFFSTHPYPERRLADTKQAIAGPYAFTQGDARYQKYPDRFKTRASPYLSP